MTTKVAVLYGGLSTEREVSLRTGEAIYQALKSKGFEAVKIDVGRDVASKLAEIRPDVAFLGLHGKYGEDGTIQGMLEIMGIPYTGPGVLASAISIDKVATKKIFSSAKISTAPFAAFNSYQWKKDKEAVINECVKLGFPVVVKAALQGSSIGVYIVRKEDELENAILEALKLDREVLVEKFISGVEVTVPIIGNDEPEVFPVIEIVTHKDTWYDYESKYASGGSSHLIPPRISPKAEERFKEEALNAYLTVGCRGISRIDAIIDENDVPYILEINTLPGMTATSLVPDSARAAGIEFPELCAKIVELALQF